MKILHAVGGLANSSGTTHIILNLSRQFVQMGHEVSIYYLTNRGYDTVLPDDPRIRAVGLPIDWKQNWGYSRAFRDQLKATVRDFDVIHVHSLWLYLNLAVGRIAHAAGVPYLVAPQGTLDDWTLRYRGFKKQVYASLIERRLLNRAAAIHAVSPRERENTIKFGVRAPVFIVPNGLNVQAKPDRAARLAFRTRHNIPDERLLLLYLGRLHPKKGLDLLLQSAADISRTDMQMVIAGSDFNSGYRAELERMVRDTHQADRVIFAGELKGNEKHEAFSSADLFALTSHSEGQPIAVLEALGYGLPVLITTGCYLPEVDDSGAGLVVPDNIQDITTALHRMIHDADFRGTCARNARKLAEARFAWPVIAGKMLQVYMNIVQNRSLSDGFEPV